MRLWNSSGKKRSSCAAISRMFLYRRPDTPHWWTRCQLNGSEVRFSTGTGNRREAEEFETVARSRAWRRVRLGERPAYLWSDAAKRWLTETRKRLARAAAKIKLKSRTKTGTEKSPPENRSQIIVLSGTWVTDVVGKDPH